MPTTSASAAARDAVDQPTVDQLPLELTLACSRFARLAIRGADVGVSSVTWRIAAALDQRGELRVSEIATLEQVTRPSATTAVQRLEEAGLVERRTDPSDSRSSLVRLTERGSDQLREWRRRLSATVEGLLADLDDDDRGALRRTAEILYGILATADIAGGTEPLPFGDHALGDAPTARAAAASHH